MAKAKQRKGTASRAAPRLLLEGDLTVAQAPAVREALRKALGKGRQVTLAFGEVGRVDLSFLQLVCALHKSARAAGKRVVQPRAGIPPQVMEAARAAGFLRSDGCGPGCLWAETEGG